MHKGRYEFRDELPTESANTIRGKNMQHEDEEDDQNEMDAALSELDLDGGSVAEGSIGKSEEYEPQPPPKNKKRANGNVTPKSPKMRSQSLPRVSSASRAITDRSNITPRLPEPSGRNLSPLRKPGSYFSQRTMSPQPRSGSPENGVTGVIMDSFGRRDKSRQTFKDPETLLKDTVDHKKQIRVLEDEKTQLRTRLYYMNLEMQKKDKQMEDVVKSTKVTNVGGKSANDTLMIANLKQRIRDLEMQLDNKNNDLKTLQADPRITKINELELESKTYFMETVRLQQILQSQELTLHEHYKSQYGDIEHNMTRYKEKLTKYAHAYQKKRDQLQQLTIDYNASVAHAKKMEDRAHTFKVQLADILGKGGEHAMEEMQSRITDCENRIHEYETKIDDLVALQGRLEKELKEERRKNQPLEQECAKYPGEMKAKVIFDYKRYQQLHAEEQQNHEQTQKELQKLQNDVQFKQTISGKSSNKLEKAHRDIVEDKAATKIQAAFKGYSTRKSVGNTKNFLVIQAGAKAFLARKRYVELKKQRKAARVNMVRKQQRAAKAEEESDEESDFETREEEYEGTKDEYVSYMEPSDEDEEEDKVVTSKKSEADKKRAEKGKEKVQEPQKPSEKGKDKGKEPVKQPSAKDIPGKEPARQSSAKDIPSKEPVKQSSAKDIPSKEPARQRSAKDIPSKEPVKQSSAKDIPSKEPVRQSSAKDIPAKEPKDHKKEAEHKKDEHKPEEEPPKKKDKGKAKLDPEQENAAIKIQSLYRGYQTRRDMKLNLNPVLENPPANEPMSAKGTPKETPKGTPKGASKESHRETSKDTPKDAHTPKETKKTTPRMEKAVKPHAEEPKAEKDAHVDKGEKAKRPGTPKTDKDFSAEKPPRPMTPGTPKSGREEKMEKAKRPPPSMEDKREKSEKSLRDMLEKRDDRPTTPKNHGVESAHAEHEGPRPASAKLVRPSSLQKVSHDYEASSSPGRKHVTLDTAAMENASIKEGQTPPGSGRDRPTSARHRPTSARRRAHSPPPSDDDDERTPPGSARRPGSGRRPASGKNRKSLEEIYGANSPKSKEEHKEEGAKEPEKKEKKDEKHKDEVKDAGKKEEAPKKQPVERKESTPEEEVAAVKIQSAFRGYQARKELNAAPKAPEKSAEELAKEREAKLKAEREQKAKEDKANKEKLEITKKEQLAATKIQAVARGHVTRKKFKSRYPFFPYDKGEAEYASSDYEDGDPYPHPDLI